MTEDIWDDIDREILQQRARALAAVVARHEARDDAIPLLEFAMMGTRYAVALDAVDAVIRLGEIHPIPLTPKHLTGVIHRRGTAVALVSLRHFFHPDAQGIADADFALIARARGKRFALQVEEIVGVTHVSGAELGPPPDNYDRAQAPFIAGVTGRGLSVIDLDRLVSAEGFAAGRQTA